MDTLYYKILNQTCRINYDLNDEKLLMKYKIEPQLTADVSLDCQYTDSFSAFLNSVQKSSVYGVRYFLTDTAKHNFVSQKDSRHLLYIEKDDYSHLNFRLHKNCSDETFLELFMIGFYSYMARKETLLMHASAVSYKGNAIVFTAPSGTGKTTQAELWQKYRNAQILNGDKVFLKQEKTGICAWGSPWKGSSEYAENQNAPLRAIVVLEQSGENKIRRLNGLEILEKVIPHVFLPQWDATCEQAVLGFLDQVLREIPVYILQCRPDEEAVTITDEALFGHNDFTGETQK